MFELPENCKWIGGDWDATRAGTCWSVNGLDATGKGKDGSIQGVQELTNQGENCSMYYAEFIIS